MPTPVSASSPALSRVGAVSLHEQIAERVLESARGLEPGAAVPSEQRLMERFGVSRTTVRKAVDTLVERGVLVRRHGRGTFVADTGVRHSLDRVSPFFAILESAGRVPETSVVSFGTLVGDAVPDTLAAVGSTALGYRRVYLTEGVPHAVLDVRIAERFARGITEADVSDTPVLRLLEERHGLSISHASYAVRATGCPRDVAPLLDLAPGSPLLVLDRSTRTPGGAPMEQTTHYLDPEVYTMTVEAGSSRGPAVPGVGLAARAPRRTGA